MRKITLFLSFYEQFSLKKKSTLTIFFLTCDEKHSKEYRKIISHFLSNEQIKKEYTPTINDLIVTELEKYEKCSFDNQEIDITKSCQHYTSSVISHLLLGHPGPFEQIGQAVNGYF